MTWIIVGEFDETTSRLHADAACVKDNRTIDFHSKSYSYEFSCPICGNRRRMNTNYLGSRRLLICNGQAIKPSARLSWDEYQALAPKTQKATGGTK